MHGRTLNEIPAPFTYTAALAPIPPPPTNLLHYLARSDVNCPIITRVLPPSLRQSARRLEDQ